MALSLLWVLLTPTTCPIPQGPTHAALPCAQCHPAEGRPTGWFGVHFRHDATGFPLSGRHLGVPCRDCHRGDRFVGQPAACVMCHGEQLPRGHRFPGARDCGDCHTPAGFNAPGFVHRPSVATGGVHGAVARECGRCHDGRPHDADDCRACHARDLSVGHRAVLRDAPADCLDCHSRAAPWSAVRFTHPGGLISGGHVGLPCGSCHPVPPAITSGAERCRSCHLHDQPTRDHPRNRDCVDCHSTAAFYPALFR